MIHFPDAIIQDRNNCWTNKTPASLSIYLQDTLNLLKSVHAPIRLIEELSAYMETLDHTLDQDADI